MNDDPRPQVINLLESFNADIAMASKDGIRIDELISIAGSITESTLKHINPIERRRCWDTLVKLMERRFERGRSMIDELLAELALNGWLFNNCYQVDSGLWRVSLRRPSEDGDWFSDWAEEPTFEEALVTCIDKLSEAEFVEAHVQVYGHEPAKAKINPQAMLQSLGLAKPQQFTRRV